MSRIYLIFPISIVLLFFNSELLYARGYALVIGGGSERDTDISWSTPAYSWAVQKSTNKRVLILGVSAPSDNWLATYFLNKCGAASAKDLTITSDLADAAWVYDTIMAHDMIFIRGGDQSRYYTLWNNKKTEQALQDKWTAGGVLAGTSAGLHVLSQVIFTAQNASITSAEAVRNTNTSSITLADDFIGAVPNVIFDSHFGERGRFGRLLTFMARWQLQRLATVTGIGVDDLTALGIDNNGLCTVFGTGAVAIYKAKNPFIIKNGRTTTTQLQLRHLLNGWGYDMQRDSIILPAGTKQIKVQDTTINQLNTVLLSSQAAIDISSRHSLVQSITKLFGLSTDGVCLISSSPSTLNTLTRALSISGVSRIVTINTNANIVSTSLNATLVGLHKFWFADHVDPIDVVNKFETHDNLRFIKQRIDSGGVLVAFSGADVRLAGSRMVSNNYTQSNAAYSRLIESSNGLSLLRNTIVFPQVFQSDVLGENGYSSVPFFMMKDSLSLGVFLHGNQTLIYQVRPNGDAQFNSVGDAPAIILSQRKNSYDFSVTRSFDNAPANPRQVAGFEKVDVAMLDTNTIMTVGKQLVYIPLKTMEHSSDTVVSALSEVDFSKNTEVKVFPNPVSDVLTIEGDEACRNEVWDMEGRLLIATHEKTLSLTSLRRGIYLLKVFEKNDKERHFKIVKK